MCGGGGGERGGRRGTNQKECLHSLILPGRERKKFNVKRRFKRCSKEREGEREKKSERKEHHSKERECIYIYLLFQVCNVPNRWHISLPSRRRKGQVRLPWHNLPLQKERIPGKPKKKKKHQKTFSLKKHL